MITPQQAIELIVEHGLTISISLSKRIVTVYSTSGNYDKELFQKEITIEDYCETVEKAVSYFEKNVTGKESK